MAGIFVNYRREDTSGYAGRVFDRLVEHFGKDQVFIDIDKITPGRDFIEAIEESITSCAALLVIIGKQWLNITDDEGNRRIDDPEDYLRLEIASALKRNVPVIPLLVKDAKMPSSKNLPEDIADLARKQALELSDERWDFDIGRLTVTLEQMTGLPPRPQPGPTPHPKPFWTTSKVTGLVVAAAAVVFITTLFFIAFVWFAGQPTGGAGTGIPAGTDLPVQSAVGGSAEPSLPPPPATVVNLAGNWFDDNSVPYQVFQQGNQVQVRVFDAFGNVVSQGAGTVQGNQVQVTYRDVFGNLLGTGNASLASDGRHLNGTFTWAATGLTEGGTLHREHLPSQ